MAVAVFTDLGYTGSILFFSHIIKSYGFFNPVYNYWEFVYESLNNYNDNIINGTE